MKLALRIARISLIICCLAFPRVAFEAEFDGENIDGEEYHAAAYSYDTGKYYDVTVEFDGDEATITFRNGRSRTLTLDEEEIDNPHSISAFDYEHGVYWDLDVDGLD